ncbi:MAG: hypothetical protein MRZ29_05270 [Oscillospiraceae bacterium]|nr:hypothetical protein [Oscillospiraceae bacterium]
MLKNLLKKLCAMCVMLTLIISCICVPSAFAAATTETVAEINGWKLIMYSGNDTLHNAFKNECSISVSNEWARGGHNSVKIVYPNKPNSSTASYWLGLSAQSIGILEPGTYVLKYSLHAVDADGNELDQTATNVTSPRNIYQGKLTSLLNGSSVTQTIGNGSGDSLSFGLGANGRFTEITRTTTISATGSGAYRTSAPTQAQLDEFLTIRFATPFSAYSNVTPAAVYIDEISLKRDGSNEELLVNSSFENNNITPTYGNKEITAYTAVGTNGNVALTWKNPVETLKSVDLYDITDGNETAVEGFSENLTAGYKNVVDLTNVAKERRYYKIVNTFSDDSVSEFILSADASANQRNYTLADGWTVKDNKANGYINKTVVDIDTAIKHSGNSSLHIRSGRSEYKDNEKLEIYQTLPALDDHVTTGYYKMSMWVKKNNADSFFTRINNQTFPGWKVDGSKDGNNFYLIQLNANNTTEYTHGWQYFEYVFSPSADTSLGLTTWTKGAAFNWAISQFDTADDVWVDDVTFIKCDANGKTIDGAENLVTNGGFEISDSDKVTGFTQSDVTATPSDGEITVSYPEIAAGEKVNIYFTNEYGKKEFKGSFYEDKQGFTFKNLVNKQNYEITVAKADAVTGIEQDDAVVLTASPVPPAVVIGDYILYDANGEAADAKTAGTYSIKLNIANNTVDEGYKAILIYALYDADNKMIDFDYDEKTVAVDTNEDFLVSNIEVENGYVLKAFLWDGFNTIKPLKPFRNFCE